MNPVGIKRLEKSRCMEKIFIASARGGELRRCVREGGCEGEGEFFFFLN